jgi:hypothetical protein
LTPKANRISSALASSPGSYVRSELSRPDSVMEQSDPVTSWPHLDLYRSSAIPLTWNVSTSNEPDPEPSSLAVDPERSYSRSKTFINKTIGTLTRSRGSFMSRSSEDSLSLIRRVSSKSQTRASYSRPEHPVYFSSSPSSSSYADPNGSTIIYESQSEFTSSANVLFPEIRITPEVESVDASRGCSLWVAVTITGVLHNTARSTRRPDSRTCSRISDFSQTPGNSRMIQRRTRLTSDRYH